MGLSKEYAAQCKDDELWEPSWEESHGEHTIKQRSAEGRASAAGGTAEPAPVKLYTSWFCEFAHRAWITLEEKGVDYEYIEVNPYEVDSSQPGGYTKKSMPLEKKAELMPKFVEAAPRGLVPGLDHVGVGKVCESLHVAAYVDESFPAGARNSRLPSDSKSSNAGGVDLLPRGNSAEAALTRAHLRIWADHCSERIWKSFYMFLFSQDEEGQRKGKDAMVAEVRKLVRAMAPESDGPFFLGKAFSFVDVALAPFWLRILWMGEYYRGLQLPDDEDFKRLEAWWRATKERPSVKATLVCRMRLIMSSSQYANNQATSDIAQQTRAGMK